MSTRWASDNIENKHTLCGEDCMKKFCTSLGEHTTKVINYKKKKMLPLTKKTKSTSRDNNMLHWWRKFLKTVC